MERGTHICRRHKPFEDNFKVMFNHGDTELFNNPNLHFIINSEIESQRSLAQFLQEIGSADLTQKYPDTVELVRKLSVRARQEEEKKQEEPSQI